jgi:hypothetical protein
MNLAVFPPIRISILYSLSMLTVFFFKGDKKLLPLFLPTCFLAGALDLWTDVLTAVYPLWQYADSTPFIKALRHFLHPFIAHFFTTFLFLQWLPAKENFKNMFFCITAWVCFAGFIEFLFLRFGELRYIRHWGYFHSIFSDYVLLIIFYFHHRWFRKKVILRN